MYFMATKKTVMEMPEFKYVQIKKINRYVASLGAAIKFEKIDCVIRRKLEMRILILNCLKFMGFLGILMISVNSALADTSMIRELKLGYDVFVGNVLAGSLDIEIDTKYQRYILESRSRSHGIFDFLFKYKARKKTVGRLTQKVLRPEYYKSRGFWRGQLRTVHISYEFVERLGYKTKPNASKDDRDLVPADLLIGTTDPLTAIFGVFTGNSSTKFCNNVLKVFDGRRRYDVELTEVARSQTKGPLYTGSARVCRARQIILAGASRRIWLPQFVRPKWMDIWVANVRPGLPILPVRFKADLGITDLVVHLVAIDDRKTPSDNDFVK